MKKTINIELSNFEVQTILNALQKEIHSDIEFILTERATFNPASECFQTFLSIVNDMNEVYLKLSSTIEEEESNE